MIEKIKRYDPNDNAPERQFVGMEECQFGDWVKEEDLLLIKNELGEIMSGMEFRPREENVKLLRRIFNRI